MKPVVGASFDTERRFYYVGNFRGTAVVYDSIENRISLTKIKHSRIVTDQEPNEKYLKIINESFTNIPEQGQYFISHDGSECIMLSRQGCVINFVDTKDNEEYSAVYTYPKEIQNRYDPFYACAMDIVSSKKKFDKLTPKEILRIAFTNFLSFYGDSTQIKILGIGDVVSGVGYDDANDNPIEVVGVPLIIQHNVKQEDGYVSDIEIYFASVYMKKGSKYNERLFYGFKPDISITRYHGFNNAFLDIETEKVFFDKETMVETLNKMDLSAFRIAKGENLKNGENLEFIKKGETLRIIDTDEMVDRLLLNMIKFGGGDES